MSPPYSFIQMLMKYTLGAQSYAGPEVEGAHFLRKRLVILPGYGQTLCTLSLCQELLVEAAHDCAQPKDIQQDFTPEAPPDAIHSATFVVGPRGPRGIMRRLSSQVLKAKEVSSISTKSIHLMLLQSWSSVADSQDSISARVFDHTVGCMGPWPALWSTFGTCCVSSDIAPIFLR